MGWGLSFRLWMPTIKMTRIHKGFSKPFHTHLLLPIPRFSRDLRNDEHFRCVVLIPTFLVGFTQHILVGGTLNVKRKEGIVCFGGIGALVLAIHAVGDGFEEGFIVREPAFDDRLIYVVFT